MGKLIILGTHDANTISQMENCLKYDFAVAGVLCADGHYGYSQPIGGVAAYEGYISMSGVGYDIGCGNACVKTSLKVSDVDGDWKARVAQRIAKEVSFGLGRANTIKVDNALLHEDSHEAWQLPHVKALAGKAAAQFGTVGSGNHFVDVFKSDSDGYIWVGCHFGSRGLGHTIATYYKNKVGAKDNMDADPALIDVDTDLGREYLMAMDLAGKYAHEARHWLTHYIVNTIMGAEVIDEVHNHHNYAWQETVNGKSCWVARKGSTPLYEGQRGFIGGSMGDISVIVRGKGMPDNMLNSTVHGAGRIMGRNVAAGKKKWVKGEDGKKTCIRVSDGLVNEAAWRNKLQSEGLLLIGAGADEMPEVYRPLAGVLEAHSHTLDVEEVLRPFIVAMAGANEFDPYKD